MVAGVVTFSLTSAPTTQKQKIGLPQTIFTDDIPLPFDTTKKTDGGSTLKGTVVQIGTNALKIPIYKVTFEDANAQSLAQDSIYMVFVPPGVNNMPFDAMIRAANGNQTKEYFGYVYSPNAQLEKDRRNEPVFSARFPGEFFVSEKGMANSRLASDIHNFETLNNIQFKTSGPRHNTANGILLENRIYAFIVNEPTATILSIRPPAICGDEWKDDSEQCDDGNGINEDGCSLQCTVEQGFICQGSPSICIPSTSVCRETANSFSINARISGDSRFIVFESEASNLTQPPEKNTYKNIYLFDRQKNQTFPLTPGANGNSDLPSISDDGRFVVFLSRASDLVSSDTNGVQDAFLLDTRDGSILRLRPQSELSHDTTDVSINGNGTFVTFSAPAGSLNRSQVYVYNIATRQVTMESLSPDGQPGTNDSSRASISNDGRYVAFQSMGSESLDAAHIRSSGTDVYIRDRQTQKTQTVSAGAVNEEFGYSRTPHISDDGNVVAFVSDSAGLVPEIDEMHQHTYLYDRRSGQRELVDKSSGGVPANYASIVHDISFDGRYTLFSTVAANITSGDTNRALDVYRYDRVKKEIARVSITLGEIEYARYSSYGSISDDGNIATFFSASSNIRSFANIFVRDIAAGTTTLLGEDVPCACMNGDCKLSQTDPVCGNNVLEIHEECDDGNLTNGDGCSSSCLTEGSPTAICGNGVVDADEQCDDGANNGQQTSVCRLECLLKVPPAVDPSGGTPNIQVLYGTTIVDQGGSMAFDSVPENVKATRTLTIKNIGTAPLKIGPTIIVRPIFTVGTFGKTVLEPGETTTLDVSIETNAIANYASLITFPTNVAGRNPFSFTAKATVISSGPNVDVLFANASVAQGSLINMGTSDPDSPTETSFDIQNTGAQDLSITNLTVPAGFVLKEPFASPTIISSLQKKTVTLVLSGTPGTTISGSIQFSTNVQTIPTFSFRVKATMLMAQIQVTQNGSNIAFETGIVDFGSTNVGNAVTKTFVISNPGTGVLTIALPENIDGFTIDPTNTSFVLQPASVTSFKVKLNATAVTNLSTTFSIGTNVLGKNPFTYTLKGIVRVPAGTLEVYDGTLKLTNGQTRDMGYNDTEHPGQKTFIIKNAGDATLNLRSPIIDVYPVTVLGNIKLIQNVTTIILEPGETTTFTVGQKNVPYSVPTGKIEIVSDDPQNEKFTIHTTGGTIYTLQGHVHATAIDNNVLYLGGEFSEINGAARTNVAAIDLVTGRLKPWGADIATDGPVYAIAVHNSITYIGGTFTTVGGQPRLLAAAIGTDGVLKTNKMPLRNAISGTSGIYAFAVDAANDRLYIGGRFGRNDFGTQTGLFQDLSLMGMRMSLWTRDTNFTPQIDGGIDRSRANIIRSIALDSSVIYVGGTFYANELNRGTSYDLAAIDSSGHILPWRPEMSDDGAEFRSLAIHGNTLYAGGNFKVTDVPIQNLAAVEKYNPAGNTTNQNGEMVWKRNWTPNPDNTVSHLLTDDENLYVAGSFTVISGISTGHFTSYKLNTMQRTAIGNPFAPSEIDALTNYDATRLILFGNGSVALLEKQ